MSSFDPLFAGSSDSGSSNRLAAVPWLAESNAQAGFAALGRFSSGASASDSHTQDSSAIARARAEGEAAGRAGALAEIAEQEQVREKLALSAIKLDDLLQEQLATRLTESVANLCETIFGPVAFDTDLLAQRCRRVAAMIGDDLSASRFRLHPEDIPLLAENALSEARIDADPALPRGTIILETANGEIHDGPDEWRARLREALGLC